MKLNLDAVGRSSLLTKIESTYSGSPQFASVFPLFESCVMFPSDDLTEFLANSLGTLMCHVGLRPEIIRSSSLGIDGELTGQRRILEICNQIGCAHYINLSGGRKLYDHDHFAAEDIVLEFVDSRLAPYPQHCQRGQFIPGLSILDVMMENDSDETGRLLSDYSLGI